MSNAESGEDTKNPRYDMHWIIHRDLGIIRYAMRTSFQWPFSEDCCESGGLIAFLEEYHKQFTQARKLDNEFLYHFLIRRFPEHLWREYSSSGNVAKLSQTYPHDLYFYNGTVWTQGTARYSDEKRYLAKPDSNNSKASLLIDISLESDSVQTGNSTSVAVLIRNMNNTAVYVPLFHYSPIQLAAVSDLDGTITKIDYSGSSRIDPRSIGMYLEPQEVRRREFELFIYPQHKQIKDHDVSSQDVALRLNKGQYTLTVFDLAPFGYPTLCNPAHLSVVGGR